MDSVGGEAVNKGSRVILKQGSSRVFKILGASKEEGFSVRLVYRKMKLKALGLSEKNWKKVGKGFDFAGDVKSSGDQKELGKTIHAIFKAIKGASKK